MSGSGQAVDAVTLGGAGLASCESWTTARRDQNVEVLAIQQWVLGFLSGLAETATIDPLNGTDGEGVYAWIDNYCQEHPIDQLVTAVEAFAKAHPWSDAI